MKICIIALFLLQVVIVSIFILRLDGLLEY